jgi:hypothetical protein
MANSFLNSYLVPKTPSAFSNSVAGNFFKKFKGLYTISNLVCLLSTKVYPAQKAYPIFVLPQK